MSRISVLEIISGFAIEGPLGGIERFGIELAQALDPQQIEPIVCGMWAYNTPYEHDWVTFLKNKNLAAFIAADWDEQKPYLSFWRAYVGTKQQINPPIDIIHSHCQFGDVMALLLKPYLKPKALVRTVHNEREWGKRPLRHHLLTNTLYPWQFNLELGVAQQVVDNLNQRRLAHLLNRQAVKSYNALNIERFQNITLNHQGKRQSLSIPLNALVVGTIGRLTEQKGYHILLDAAAKVIEKQPQTYFLIVGSGHLQEQLQQQAQQLGIDNQVIFTGARHDIEDLLALMDLFVNSSLWEGLPTVIMESMAAYVPVIATTVSGNLELIQNGKTGLLVPPNDAPKLADAIIKLGNMSIESRQQMTKHAQSYVNDHFSITVVAQQHQQLYQQLMAG